MLVTNLHYNSQKRYEEEESILDNKIQKVKIDKKIYQENNEHKQLIIQMSEGIETSEQAQELKEELEKKLNVIIKVIKHTRAEQNAKEHYHFQILSNSVINNQTIYKVANDFIKAIKGGKMTQVRIFDNSKKNSFSLSAEATAELQKVKEDKFSFIKKDSKSYDIEEIKGYSREGSKNATGMGKLDRPYYILNGVSNKKAKLISRFGIGMFKSNDIEITKETAIGAIKSFFESIGQELGENSEKFLNLEIEESESELSINFNNLIVLKNGHIASIAKNLMEEHLSNILNHAISNEHLIIENEDRLKSKEKVLGELHYLNGETSSEGEQTVSVTPVEEISTIDRDKHIDFITILKAFEKLEEFEVVETKLNEEANKIEAVRGILENTIIDKKLQEIREKQSLLQSQKEELNKVHSLNFKLEEQENTINDYIVRLQEIDTKVEEFKSVISSRDITINEQNEIIKTQTDELDSKEKMIVELETLLTTEKKRKEAIKVEFQSLQSDYDSVKVKAIEEFENFKDLIAQKDKENKTLLGKFKKVTAEMLELKKLRKELEAKKALLTETLTQQVEEAKVEETKIKNHAEVKFEELKTKIIELESKSKKRTSKK